MTDTPDNVIPLEKSYFVSLTEREMQALANCVAALFNHLTAQKKTIPPAYAELTLSALQKMRQATVGSSLVLPT